MGRTTIRISSSIANFREKLLARTKLLEWHWWRNRNDRTIFFGLYHYKDYLRFIWHRGPKKVFWCGSDILNLEKSLFRFVLPHIKAKHYCENHIEAEKLGELGIIGEIRPMIFDDPDKYQISYEYSNKPILFMTYHVGREEEYGLIDHPQIDFYVGWLEKDFNEVIKYYQGAFRANKFDGFAEILAKSVLMGQYPISYIRYPYIACLQDISLEKYLEKLKTKKRPNYEAEKYWRQKFAESLEEILK